MRIRNIIMILAVMFIAMPAQAVLKEKNLGETLSILRDELQHTHDDMGEQQKIITQRSQQLRDQLINTMNRANQNALMLYSQKPEYVFDLTYACQEATDQYREFKQNVMPFKLFLNKSNNEVARYDSLIQSLTTMPLMGLDDKAKIDRNVCLTLAVNIRRMVVENQQTLADYMRFYQFSEARLKNLNDYAQTRYNDIQNNIFINGSDNYFTILQNLSYNLMSSEQTIQDKYSSNQGKNKSVERMSQWDYRVIIVLFVIIFIYVIIAILLNQIVIRLIVTRLMRLNKFEGIRDTFMAKRKCIIMATTVVTFGILVGIIQAVTKQNFVLMASSLLVEYAWLMSVVLIGILIRVEAAKTMRTVRIYAPLLVIGFLVIAFRIVLIPNILVNLIFPPVLLICTLWQFNCMKRCRKDVSKSDNYYALMSFIMMVVSTVCSWIGFTLLSVQILIWWIMMLTCILTITCINDLFKDYAERHNIQKRPITETWFYYFITKTITPAAAVMSVLFSIYWAASVFNLTDITRTIFTTNFIDYENITVSLFSITQVLNLWFIFRYINNTACQFVRYKFEKKDHKNAASRSMMYINVIQVVVWGAWLLLSLALLHISNTWLMVISGGLSTGIGFALKDILENIYYGISLMAGRIKIGDLIICDGIRGKVTSVSYTSTLVEAADGSIIAFQNSQLFTKNYKNLTHNNGYEAQIVEVGVAYGSDISKVRQLLSEAVSEMACVETKHHKVAVLVSSLGDNSVNLKVVAWLNAATAVVDAASVLETIYNTLNDNNIEIPFPQRDVHLVKSGE